MIWERYVDAAGEFFDELAANCLDTTVSEVGGEGFPPRKMSKDQNANEKKEWRKSSGFDSLILSVTELGEVCSETKQKHEVYPCWVCSNNISTGSSVGCEDCHAWAHA